MKYKFAILMVVIALLSFSLVSANYDLQVTGVTLEPSSPINGYATDVIVEVLNIGPNNIVGENINLNVDFNDTTTDNFQITDLNAGDSIQFTSTHTWTTNSQYSIDAVISGMINDSNVNTDKKTKVMTVIAPVISLSSSDLTLTPMLRGDSKSFKLSIANSGNVDATISNSFITDLKEVSGTETITNTNVAITAPNTISASSSKDVNLQVSIPSNAKPATYTGDLSIVYLDAANTQQTLVTQITVIVENSAATISAIPNQIVIIGNTFTYNVVANDVEGDTLTYSLSGPTGMTINNVTGAISWSASIATTSTVSVNVFDGFDTTTQSFVIQSKPDAPSIAGTTTNIEVGGSSTIRGSQVSNTFIVENTGTQTLNNLQVSVLSNTGSAINSVYSAVASIPVTTLAPGAQTSVSVSVTIPADQDSQPTTIGKVRVTGDGTVNSVYDDTNIIMEAKSYLNIIDVEIEVNNDDNEDLSDGENYDLLKEGDEVKLTLKLENDYSSSDNIDIENAYFEITDNNDWDIDEESDEVDIKDNDEEELVITFKIPQDLDDDQTTVTIEAYGDDEDGNFIHYDTFEFDLEIDREDDEISITSWSFDREPADCNDAYATLNVRIKNTGTDDQDEVTLLVQSDKAELDWYKRITDIELDESDSDSYSFNIPIKNVEEGSYFVEISTYYSGTRKSDNEVIGLEVVCKTNTGTTTNPNPTNPNTGSGTIVVTNPQEPSTPTANAPVYGEPVSATENFRSSNNYMIILMILVIALLLGVIGLVIKMFIK